MNKAVSLTGGSCSSGQSNSINHKQWSTSMTDKPFNGFATALMSKERHLGQPRQASHKLNKRQHKANCGYKETSAKRQPIMPTSANPVMRVTDTMTKRDKTFGHESSGICATPLFGAKTYKRFKTL